jgi:hypothetical protein
LGRGNQKGNSFSIPAKVLQANSQKESIRQLNEEFTTKGGRVSFKSTTKGQSVQLSHPDTEYLAGFEKRLLKECGLLEEEEASQEGSTSEAPKEEGEKDEERSETPDERDISPVSSEVDSKAAALIEEAVSRGAIDDGQIIKYAYTKKAPDKVINTLRKKLWGNKCRLADKKCRFKRKQINFEETMKSCTGVRNDCEYVDSELLFLFPQWKKNVEEMFGEFKDKQVKVRGKISYAKFVEREEGAGSHYKFLIYDTMVNNKEDSEDKEPKETRKLWAKVSEKDFNKMNTKEKFKMEDIVDIEGTIVWNSFFYDYWIEEITSMKVAEAKGEMPIKP